MKVAIAPYFLAICEVAILKKVTRSAVVKASAYLKFTSNWPFASS